MKHTTKCYYIPARSAGDYESVAIAYAVAKAPDNLPEGGRAGFYGVIYSHIERAGAIIQLRVLGFYCVSADINDDWGEQLIRDLDKDMRRMWKRR